MKIYYFGHSCFKIEFDEGLSVVTDPYTGVGYELPQGIAAEVVTCSHRHFDHDYLQGIRILQTALTQSGKFTLNAENGVLSAEGFESFHDEKCGVLRGKNIVFKLNYNGITVCHMGDIGEPVQDVLADKIGRPDILLIPVGGTYTIDARGAREYVERLRPKIVIPMHFGNCGGTLDIAGVEEFLEQFRSLPVERVGDCYEPDRDLAANVTGKIILMQRCGL